MRSLRSKAIKPLSLRLPFIRFTEFYDVVFVLLIFVGYQTLAYLGSSAPGSGGLAVLSAFSPAVIILLLMSWTTHYRIIWFFCIISGCIALWHYHSTFTHYLTWVYMIQRSGIFVLLTAVFGVTLLPGHTPIISRIADLVHGPLSERVALYTRHVTIAWVFFFAIMTGLPLVIFLFAPQNLLFLLTNIITVTLLASMFFTEYIVRCRSIPVGERSGMIEGLHAYFHYTANTATNKRKAGNSNPGPPR